MTKPAIVLASSSITRQKQLRQFGIPHTIDTPDIDETPFDHEDAEQLVTRLAIAKAKIVGKRHTNAIIIAGDQVLSLGKSILGKPMFAEKAMAQLKCCSGKIGFFYTGVAIFCTERQQSFHKTIASQICYNTLSSQQISQYLQLDQPFKCAGSIQIESAGITLVKNIHSSDPFAILGLPLQSLTSLFKNSGYDLIGDFCQNLT